MSLTLEVSTQIPAVTIGLDVGDRISHLYMVGRHGERLEERTVATTPEALRKLFTRVDSSRVVLEVGTHSRWISQLVAGLGHEVFVANPSAMYGTKRRRKRNDKLDAEFLARQGRADVSLLHAIRHRGDRAHAHLELLRARDQVVQLRSKLINHVRGSVKSSGHRLPACSAEAFAHRVSAQIPEALRIALQPLLDTIRSFTITIRQYDAEIEQLLVHTYPDGARLRQVAGVGPITALAFLLLIDDPHRFRDRRDVAAYFGLVPRLDESSDSTPQLRITKAGDPFGRRLLVSAAQYIMGPFGPPTDLRHHGEGLMLRGGRNAKKRAVVAVARKLAVLLHALWTSGTPYEPLHNTRQRVS